MTQGLFDNEQMLRNQTLLAVGEEEAHRGTKDRGSDGERREG